MKFSSFITKHGTLTLEIVKNHWKSWNPLLSMLSRVNMPAKMHFNFQLSINKILDNLRNCTDLALLVLVLPVWCDRRPVKLYGSTRRLTLFLHSVSCYGNSLFMALPSLLPCYTSEHEWSGPLLPYTWSPVCTGLKQMLKTPLSQGVCLRGLDEGWGHPNVVSCTIFCTIFLQT